MSMQFFVVIWWLCLFIIFEAMIGYPCSLILLDKIRKKQDNKKNFEYKPTVTIMVVAHNEEKVIRKKLNNIMELDYPKEMMKILVTSDYSTDNTDEIVEKVMNDQKDWNIELYKTINHFGKTNAQNEAQKFVDSEILVMTDANAMLEKNSINELVSSFVNEDIAYVCGRLKYTNADKSKVANSEGLYWKIDLICRDIESHIQTITAGNGALYACRNKDYIRIENIKCHDSWFPLLFALKKKRAIYNSNAIAYEKAGEIVDDEFKRKIRMNRNILNNILPDLRILNVFEYKWFTYFYFGHRTCRYLLWLAHMLLFVMNLFLMSEGILWCTFMGVQVLFLMISLFGWKRKSKNTMIRIMAYYCMTVVAQWYGVVNMIMGKSKPIWEKAESTR